MTTQNPDGADLKALWKDQKSDHPALSAEEVRARVGIYHAKIRNEGALSLALCAAVGIVCLVLVVTDHPARLIGMSVGMVAIWDLWWEIAVFYRTRDTVWPWLPRSAMTDESPTACVEFYRVVLESRQKHWFMSYIDLYFMGAVFIINILLLRNQIPVSFYVLTAFLLFLMVLVRKSQARRMDLEIGALEVVRPR